MMAKRFGWCLVAAVLVMAVGCKSKSDEGGGDGDGDASIQAVSGERIRLRTWSGGGIEWVESAYDSELDADCTFTTATDGNLYCFPGGDANTTGVNVAFSDEDCTEVIGRAWESDCTEVARYATLDEVSDCYPRQVTLYEVGAEVDLPDMLYERDWQGNCVAGDASGQGYELTKVPLDELTMVTREVVPRTSDLGVLMYASEDGLRLPMNTYDLNRDFVCHVQNVGPREESTEVCVGNLAYTDTAGNYGYGDSDCEGLVAGATQCGEPGYITSYSQVDECWETELFEVGSKVDDADVHRITGDVCEPLEDPYYSGYYEVGAAVDTSKLPHIELSPEGETRLVRATYRSDGASVYPSTMIWDTTFDSYCYPRVIDGKTYCVPSGTYEMNLNGSWFADDACTVRLEYVTESPCYEYEIAMIGTWSELVSCGIGQLDAIHSVEIYEEDVVYVVGPEGDCVEEPIQEDAIYFMAGDELDPDEILVEISSND